MVRRTVQRRPEVKMSTHPLRIAGSPCPQCFKLLNAVDAVGESEETPKPPEPGDFTVCIACFSVLRFDDNMHLVSSSLSEVPIEIRARIAFIKMTVEDAARKWNAKGGRPWCNR
jgi:hypothetical protein